MNGKFRVIDPSVRRRISELMRTSVVMNSEISGAPTADGAFPVTVDLIRRSVVTPAQPSIGIAAVWGEQVIQQLVGHVRRDGDWEESGDGIQKRIKSSQRVVNFLDVEGLNEGDDLVYLTDRIRFTDQVFGQEVFEVLDVRHRVHDRMVTVLCEYARED